MPSSVSAKARAKISASMKDRWAERKRAAANSPAIVASGTTVPQQEGPSSSVLMEGALRELVDYLEMMGRHGLLPVDSMLYTLIKASKEIMRL